MESVPPVNGASAVLAASFPARPSLEPSVPNAALRDPQSAEHPGLWAALVGVLRDEEDGRQLAILLLGACAWVGYPLVTSGGWWLALGLCALSILMFVGTGTVGALIWYYEDLRLAKREATLRASLQSENAINEERVALARLAAAIESLTEEVRGLRTGVDDVGRSRANVRGWLDRWRGRWRR
jgi:hypothetical protein